MPEAVSPQGKTSNYVGIIIILLSIVLAWVASDFARSYPLIYQYPQASNRELIAVLVIGLVLLVIGLPVALWLFDAGKVFLVVVCLVFLPIDIIATKNMGNVLMSGGELKKVSATLIGKRQWRGTKSHAYLLQVQFPEETQIYEFAVSYTFFKTAMMRETISIDVSPGYFGQPWVGSYARVEN